MTDGETGPPSSCANATVVTSATTAIKITCRFMNAPPVFSTAETARGIPRRARLLHSNRTLLAGARRARDGADYRPVVFVHDDRLLRFRPEVDGDVVVAVAEDAGLDGEVS